MSCHLSCWRRCWWGRSWCCISLTLRPTTTCIQPRLLVDAVDAGIWPTASSDVLNIGRLLCCPPCVGAGIKLWLAGRSHRHLHGWGTSWRSSFNVSVCNFAVVKVWNWSGAGTLAICCSGSGTLLQERAGSQNLITTFRDSRKCKVREEYDYSNCGNVW